MSIIGTGIDIVEISRIGRAIARNPRFLARVFTSDEVDYFLKTGNRTYNIAGTFAAKEAVLKSLGTGLRDMGWKDIEITRNSLGKPSVILHGNAKALASDAGIMHIHISISHEREHAIAGAVAEGGLRI